ncbi:ComF family protein [Ureibacillus sp. 179-F W5.1 NHS]|uniref:ComF family protein n=1 Tax=Lysinibacillus halotolerans TaxID=1368476 RepID=A0A3M8HEF8_9BACI|nr:phosphoribosyltransferase family protein [Lysinibacillus halotolerans]RND00679.1 ComF family protein [Lysinibacillus halotolerans]
MKRFEVRNCLLCNTPLNEPVTWKLLLTNHFPKTICFDCEKKFEPYENKDKTVISLFRYNNPMKDYLHRYKFLHDVILAKIFREQIHMYLSKQKAVIVPIPMHPLKLKERTFSHVDELLKEANVPFTHYLEKITTETQGGKSRQQRLKAPPIFRLKNGMDVKGKDFILVDDIYTTGTTIQHGKKVLLDNGANCVTAFTLIRG